MPLPPALLARLQKRGLVAVNKKAEVEEVFAEDYDRTEVVKKHPDSQVVVYEIINCPNKVNPYHECIEYCAKKWGVKKFEPLASLEKRRQRLVRKYPLPDGWLEVGDPDTGRCYYWNLQTDMVSWLPPQHPRAKVTLSAEKLQSMMKGGAAGKPGPADKRKAKDTDGKTAGAASAQAEQNRKGRLPEKRARFGRSAAAEDMLDPMDPAAYSEVPRGSWSDGMETGGSSAKTGVDVTANGPLFQQRPYPSPGDVLRANRSATQK